MNILIIGKIKEIKASLNELILFGGNACNNARSLEMKIIQDLKMPTLKLAYPTNQKQLIELIDRTNAFLKNLDDVGGIVNDDELTLDLYPKRDKYPIFDVKNLLDSLI